MIIDSSHALGMKVACLVAEAKAAEETGRERRRENRYPLFREVTIVFPDKAGSGEVSAFSRDISAYDIGLIHNSHLAESRVHLKVIDELGECIELQAEIMWCRPCGVKWFISGARFIE